MEQQRRRSWQTVIRIGASTRQGRTLLFHAVRPTVQERRTSVKKRFGHMMTVGLMLLMIPWGLGGGEALAAVPFQVGDVFAGVGTGKIKHFSPTGTLLETLDTTTGSSEDTGMCFDAAGNLYATDFSISKMSKFDKNGNLVAANFGSGFNADPESCIVDASQNIYVGQADGSHQVLKFNTSGASLGSFAPATQDRGTDWIDLASDQCTIFYTSEGSSVKRFNVCTNTQLPDFATGLSGPCYALRIRPNGEVLVACSSQAYRLNSNGSVNQTYQIADGTLFALNLDPDGTHFWTAGLNSGNVYKVEIATGAGTAAPLFNADVLTTLAGLAVFGEPTASQQPSTGKRIPTLNEWGMLVLVTFLGLASAYYLRRSRAAGSVAK
jgi:hypothetical protein